MREGLPGGTLAERIRYLDRIGSEDLPVSAIAADELVEFLIGILTDRDFAALPVSARGGALYRILLLYSASWDSTGRRLIPAVESVFAGLLSSSKLDLNALCTGYDLLFFLYWCWETEASRQSGFASNVVRPFAAAVRAERRAEPLRGRLRWTAAAPRQRVGLLAEFVTPGPGNAIAGANEVLLRTLARAGGAYRPILYAWMFHDPTTLARYEASGVEVRPIVAEAPSQRLALTEAAIRADRPDVVISDMNAAIPTVLFERRVAPRQVFYQFGLPYWPISELDAVFHVWDFDRTLIGFDPAICTELKIPYDTTRFARPADPARLAEERSRLPAGRLIGTYGRLAKITREFVALVADAIRDIPDVTVVLGGSGDASPIHAWVSELGVAHRFSIHARYVDGHVWGHLLDVFLDTFPQPGGASCLEVIAKGKPVVGLLAKEAPNLSREQRVAELSAEQPDDFIAILRRLLREPTFYAQACALTRSLAARYPTEADYQRELTAALARLRARPAAGFVSRLMPRFVSARLSQRGGRGYEPSRSSSGGC